MKRLRPDNFSKEAIDHAWDWFSLHANQRMQNFNFFLVATAFLVAAYGGALENHTPLALGIGLLGTWIAFWFNRLEKRTKQLVKAGEAALAPSQQRLSEVTGIPSLTILSEVEVKAPGSSSYAVAINAIQQTILAAFVVGATYAGWLLYAQ